MEEYSSEYSVATFADHFVVGAQSSGTDILQNMFGLYVRYDQNLFDSNMTNMKLSTQAHNYFWRPLVGTSLTKTTAKDNVTKEKFYQKNRVQFFWSLEIKRTRLFKRGKLTNQNRHGKNSVTVLWVSHYFKDL